MTTRAFHITVGTGPQTDVPVGRQFGVSLAHEIRIIKAALLYADKVTLCSPASSLILSVLAARNLNLVQQIELLQEVAPMLVPGEPERLMAGLAMFKAIASKLHLTPDEEQLFQTLRAEFVSNWRNLQHLLDVLREESGAGELIVTLNTGLVEIHPLSLERSMDPLMDDFLQAIMGAVSSGETYPLFDEQVSSLVRAGISKNLFKASPTAVVRGKHTALAGNLLERLPLFG